MSSVSDEKLSQPEVQASASVLESAEGTQKVDPGRVLRKLDARLLPIVCALFIFAYLDRTNIGNAKVAGLSTDLHLTGLQFSLGGAIFFIPYWFFEIPSNLILKTVTPSIWIPLIAFCWGAVLVAMAFVKNYSGLLAARFFLGVAESGIFAGLTFYLCLWYPREVQAHRIAIFSSTSAVAAAFGGLLAFAIEKMSGIGGLHGWSWIFVLEGLATTIVAVVAYFVMPNEPENATFLTDAEREWLVATLKAANTSLSKDFKWKFLGQALGDVHSYLMIGVFFFVFISSVSFSLFLPTIISGLGYSASNAQLLTVPPYVSAVLLTVVFGYLSDRLRTRGPFVLASTLLSLIGYIILYATSSSGAGYAGIVIAATGIYPAITGVLAWTGANIGGDTKRAVVIAMVIGSGNLGGMISSFIYRPQDAPRYHLGHAINIACLCIAALLCAIAIADYVRLNRIKAAQCARDGLTEDNTSEFADAGDASPLYRYII